MNIIKDKEFQGERPLFFQHDLRLENIKILNGESAIKEGHNIVAVNSYFNGKYPFWHINDFETALLIPVHVPPSGIQTI